MECNVKNNSFECNGSVYNGTVTYDDYPVCTEVTIVEGSYRNFNYSGGFNVINEQGNGCLSLDNFYIVKVVYSDPATIMFFSDGTKTVAKTHNDDKYSKETGFVLCLLKKLAGSTNVHDLLKYWIPCPDSECACVTNADVRKKRKSEE